jgi:hypothetical protein
MYFSRHAIALLNNSQSARAFVQAPVLQSDSQQVGYRLHQKQMLGAVDARRAADNSEAAQYVRNDGNGHNHGCMSTSLREETIASIPVGTSSEVCDDN